MKLISEWSGEIFKKQEIESLKLDTLRVRSSRAKGFIEKEIRTLERMIERREYKLWKLSK